MKIYLQAVRFVVIDKVVPGVAGEKGKYESYEIGDDSAGGCHGIILLGQTFTPQETHNLTSVFLKLYRIGTPPPGRLSIYACNGEHKPTGSELTGADTDFSEITQDSAGEWIEIDLPTYSVLAETEYAIALDNPDGAAIHLPAWLLDASSPLYTRGLYVVSFDNGVSWAPDPTKDFMFQEWGISAGIPPVPGLIHVRHPALLTVVQKRAEVVVKGYDTLSSLDGEYFTGQVGLDVHVGDVIEATTLPGIDYDYLVK